MADSTLNILIKLRNTAQAGITKLKKNLKESAEAAEQLGDADVDELDEGIQDLNESLEETKEKADEAAESFDNIRNAGLKIAAIGAAIATPFLLAAKAAGEFQTQIAEIETLVPASTTANEELRESVINLSNEFGVDRASVSAALYQTISTGADAGADANARLAVALTLARAGVASVETATFGLATVLNAFNLEGTEAARVADSLFTTVRGGATTIEQLSSFLFQAAPLANALGVEFQELNAAIQTITLSGTPTAQATTQIRAALQGLARDTPEVTEALGEFNSVSEAIRKQGLQKTFDQIRKASKGSEAALIKMLGSIEGVQALLLLTTKDGGPAESFTKALRDQEEALGAAARAADIVEQSFGVQLEQAIVRVSNAFTELGEAVIPILIPIVEGVSELAVAFQEFLAASEVAQNIVQFTLVLGALLAVVGTAAVVFGVLGKAIKASFFVFVNFGRGLRLFTIRMARATTATRLLKVGIRGLFGPVGIVIGLLASLAISASVFADDMKKATDAVDSAIESFSSLAAIDKIRALDIAEIQVARLTQLAKEAKATVDGLKATAKEGGLIANIRLDFGSSEEDAKELAAQLKEAVEKRDKLKELFIVDIQTDLASKSVEGLTQDIEDLEFELLVFENAFKKLRIELGKPLPAIVVEEEGTQRIQEEKEDLGVINKFEQIRLDRITAQSRQRLDAIEQIKLEITEIQRREKLLSDAERTKKATARAELTRKQEIAALQSAVQITGAENKLAEAQAQSQADLIKAVNVQLTIELEDQLDRRLIDAKEFAAERKKIIFSDLEADRQVSLLALENARALADAKILVLKKSIDEEKLLRQVEAGGEQAAGAQATLDLAQDKIEREELAFATIEANILKRIALLGIRATAAIEAIASDLAEGSVEGIEKAFDRLITQLGQKQVSIAAQLEVGAITQTEAQAKLAEAASDTADVLEGELIPAVEKLLLTAPEDPVLLALLAKIREELNATKTSLSEFEQGLAVILESELAGFFEELLNGFDDLAEAADKFIQGLRSAVLKLIAERLANKLIKAVFGNFLEGGVSVPSPAQGGFIKAAGGGVLKLAKGSGPGGRIRGLGTSTSDSVPAMLSDGEYVMRAKSVRQYGLQMMEAINRGIAPRIDVERRLSITKPPMRRFQEGGAVGSPPSAAQLRAGASASGQQRSEQPTELVLNISDDALNSMMRDVLEREFGRILATR